MPESRESPHPPLLAARGLRFARNEQPVFGPLDFAVDAGEALLVLAAHWSDIMRRRQADGGDAA